MKFHVNRDVFSEAVSFVVKLLPQRNPQPILAGVLIEASDAGLSLAAFDYEVSARTTIEATVDEPGTILVSGRLLSEIASRLPNAPIQVEVDDDGGIVLSCGSARFTLASMPVQEYPAIPEVSGDSGLVPGRGLRDRHRPGRVRRIARRCHPGDHRRAARGDRHNSLSLVATDRYRVAVREIPWDGGGTACDEPTTALVPARTLTEVGKTFAHGGDISIAFSGSGDREIIAFTAGNKTVTSLLIKGNFPPVRRLFPEQTENYAVRQHRRAHRGRAPRVARARPLGAAALHLHDRQRLDGCLGHRAGPGVRVHRRAPHRRRRHPRAEAAVPARVARRGHAASSCASRSPRARTPTSSSPVLITPQTSVDKAGAETFKYLLQPNLLLR